MDMMKPNLLTAVMVLSVGATVALSGCSQTTKANAVTLASQQ
nr:hypothetical protein [Psychrobacter frigidicola]